jgi:hypothetical protein
VTFLGQWRLTQISAACGNSAVSDTCANRFCQKGILIDIEIPK